MRAKVKKWGNSLGLIIPADLATKERLKDGDEVEYQLKKCDDIKELFGKYPMGDIKKIKNELRREWTDVG